MAPWRPRVGWGLSLASVLLGILVAVALAHVLDAPRARRTVEASLSGQRYYDGERDGFRWEGGLRRWLPGVEGSDVPSLLRPWPPAYGLPWTRWGSEAVTYAWGEDPRVVVCLRSGEIGLGTDPLPDAFSRAHTVEFVLPEKLRSEGRPPAFHLEAQAREQWSDVAHILRVARRHLPAGEPWSVAVCRTPYRGYATWPMSFALPHAAAGPSLRLVGKASEREATVTLDVGASAFRFPAEPRTLGDVYDEYGQVPLTAWRDASDPPAYLEVGPWDSIRWLDAANRVWPDAEAALRAAVAGRSSVGLSIDDRGGRVRWGYVVAVLDVLMSAGVDTVTIDSEAFALHLAVPRTPDPLSGWHAPRTASPRGRLLAALAGALLALACALFGRAGVTAK